ncbi:MAG: DUF427 domain-containing protein [Myxococcota bacterium]
MARAMWNGVVLAESDDIVTMEGNAYFPRESLSQGHFEASTQTTICPWKGTASYFDVVVDGARNAGAAWYYATPKDAAAEIKGRVAFWRGVVVG